jgi:hypothetical protein
MSKIGKVLASAYKEEREIDEEILLQLSIIPEDTTHLLLAFDQENDERLVGCLTLRTIIPQEGPATTTTGLYYFEMDKVAVIDEVKKMGVDRAMYNAVKDLIQKAEASQKMHKKKGNNMMKIGLRSSVSIVAAADQFEIQKEFLQKQGFVFLRFEQPDNKRKRDDNNDDSTWISKLVYVWNM